MKEYKDRDIFVKDFITYSQKHSTLLDEKEYGERSNLDSQLRKMVKTVASFSEPASIVREIIKSGNVPAIIWIANTALDNNWYKATVIDLLKQIMNGAGTSCQRADAYTILLSHKIS